MTTSACEIGRPRRRLTQHILAAAGLIGALAAPATAQLPNARVVEWNCPVSGGEEVTTQPPDPFPGALVADGGFVWWVTRAAPQLFRLTPGSTIDADDATCNWWNLDELTVTTGGLRLRPFGSDMYIRTFNDLQRIRTTTNARTRWLDGLISFSDVTVHSNGSVTVYTTGAALLQAGTAVERTSDVVQRFVPSATQPCPADAPPGAVCSTAFRYEVGGGAGQQYLSGVDVHPTNPNVVYYSEPLSSNIGELRIAADGTAAVRRWNLIEAGLLQVLPEDVFEPRQLKVTSGGLVVGVTGSGHLFRLNPTTNEILVAPIPNVGLPASSPINNPFGVDGNGFVGFTTAGEVLGYNKVGMWFPDGIPAVVTPVPDEVFVEAVPVPGLTVTIPQFTATTPPVVKLAPALETETAGGTVWEALIDQGLPQDTTACTGDTTDPDTGLSSDPCSPSLNPLGIADDPGGNVGDYFAAIGLSINRIAHVSIPVQTAGTVSGGGFIETTETTTDPLTNTTTTTTTSKGTFGLVAMRKHDGDPVKGHVTFIDHLDNDKVISVELTGLAVDGNKAQITGFCKQEISNCLQFAVDVTDNGQPRSTIRDTFEIARDAILGVSSGVDGGPLVGGNLKVRATSSGN